MTAAAKNDPKSDTKYDPKSDTKYDLKADVNRRAAALFAAIDDYDEAAFLAAIDALAAELPEDDADALFHRGSARDSWGHSDLAVPLYRKALELGGLTGENRRRAVIQMCSSLRNIGEVELALETLWAERELGEDHLSDALDCTIALCLATTGHDREGLSLVLVALAKHLPRYNRSMANYGRALVE
ncbi:MAG: tetratricopeptide repeat protein [Catenulispora sp.]|nr:tetratricopeptide repeat protein [Catenulispora sp.]